VLLNDNNYREFATEEEEEDLESTFSVPGYNEELF